MRLFHAVHSCLFILVSRVTYVKPGCPANIMYGAQTLGLNPTGSHFPQPVLAVTLLPAIGGGVSSSSDEPQPSVSGVAVFKHRRQGCALLPSRELALLPPAQAVLWVDPRDPLLPSTVCSHRCSEWRGNPLISEVFIPLPPRLQMLDTFSYVHFYIVSLSALIDDYSHRLLVPGTRLLSKCLKRIQLHFKSLTLPISRLFFMYNVSFLTKLKWLPRFYQILRKPSFPGTPQAPPWHPVGAAG